MNRRQALLLTSVIVLTTGLVGFTGITGATDEKEPNDDFETAQPITEGNVSGDIFDGESDFFEMQANTTDAVRVNLEDAVANDLALRVYNSDQEQIVGESSCCGVPGPLTKKLSETGTYYIEVAGTTEQKTTAYTLDYEKITPTENDPFAPNSNFTTAASLSEGFHDAKIWGGESDFYEIQTNTTDAIQVNLENAVANDLGLIVYNSDREAIVSRYSCCSVPGPLTKKFPETGTYYIEVAGTSNQKTTAYTLDYDKITPTENDPFAPNSNFTTAASLSEGFHDAKIWGGESDFYEIQANTTDAIQVNLENAVANDLGLIVYNSDREEVVSRYSCCSVPGPLTKKFPETGTYYIEVAGTSNQKTTAYALDYDKITPTENDPFAPNSNFTTAASLSEGFHDAKIWGGESDFYEIQANTTDAIQVNLENAIANDLGLIVYNSDREEIVSRYSCCGVPGPLTKKFPETGTYYIEVAGTSNQKTTAYTLDYDRITPTENDPFAPNSNFSTASLLTQQFTDAKIWGGESDFYRVALTANETIEVNIENADANDLALRMYNSDQAQIAGGSTCCTVPGPLTKEVPETGTYYIEFAGTSNQKTTAYTVESNKSNTDSDGDSIPDVIDEAPNEPEDFDGCEDSDGAPDNYICPLADDPPEDIDGDGLYEDVNGNGEFGIFDVQVLFENQNSDSVQNNPGAFNFDGEGTVDIFDVQALFEQLN